MCPLRTYILLLNKYGLKDVRSYQRRDKMGFFFVWEKGQQHVCYFNQSQDNKILYQETIGILSLSRTTRK